MGVPGIGTADKVNDLLIMETSTLGVSVSPSSATGVALLIQKPSDPAMNWAFVVRDAKIKKKK